MAFASVRPWLFAAASLMPAGGAFAQSQPATPAHDARLQDVGTWDAEIVRWDAGGANGVRYSDADHRIVTMSATDRQGNETRVARVVYTRRR